MATFEAQVEALTGISIDGSSNPTQTELSLFLVDGVKDVIHRMIKVKPEELVRFTSTTNSTSSIAQVGKIFTVVREHDSTTILRKCKRISAGDRYDATDVDSLKYRSKYNPGFYELNGSIFTVPEAGSGNNDIVVTQIFYDTGVAYGDEVPDNFPESYAYLVALYAGIKSLQNALSAVDISSFSLTSVPPDVPTLSESSVTITGTAPIYNAPSLTPSDSSSEEITEMEPGTIGSAQTDTEQWFDIAGDFIETEEDTELAAAQIQKISAYLQAYSAAMQNKLHIFNDANVEYQATLQKDIKNADFDNQEEARLLQKYGAEVQEYQAEVAAEVQTYQQEVAEKSTEYQWQTARLQDLKQEYAQAFAIMAPPPPQAQQPQRRARR